MANRDRDDVRASAMEIAIDARSLPINSLRNSQATADSHDCDVDINNGTDYYLFGGYVDPPKEHRIGTATPTI
ncbi:MAG: hypothetical protein ACM3KL_03555 [Alphaproteobacteria bacterium]